VTISTLPGLKRLRVVIVDDSMFMRAAIAKTLSAGPFDVVGQAKDGKEALERIVALSPDVVTMDFNMPGMNGAETVRALMAQRPTPVVMFSAHTRQGAKETFDALAAGAVDFVTKPAGEVSVRRPRRPSRGSRRCRCRRRAPPRAGRPRSSGPRPCRAASRGSA
jgi:two-component system chemotaxis response regulator CheB